MSNESALFQLYAYPNTYSIGVHLLLEEAGVSYNIINPKTNPAQTDAAFLRASPHARVPALILPNGSTMCESSAIALHLADSLCDQQFSISPNSVNRGRYLQWLFYLSSTVQPDVMIVFHPEYYFSDKARQAEIVAAAQKRLRKVWNVLEQEYSQQNHGSDWLFDTGPTAVDFSLATVLQWPECFPISPNTCPALSAMLQTMSKRDSFSRIIPWHQGIVDTPPSRVVSAS